MSSCYWADDTEEKSTGLVKTFRRGYLWYNLEVDFRNSGTYPPKFATNISATASADFFARYDYWGDERGRIYDADGSANGEMMLSEKIGNNSWVNKSVNLVSKGKVPSALTTSGSGLFTVQKDYLLFETFADVQQTLGQRRHRVSISWTDPTLTISTSATEGGSVTFTNGNGTATYNGNQRYTIPYYKKTCICTITAVALQGYDFVGWSDGVTSATRTLSYTDNNLTSSATVFTFSAIFQRKAASKIYIGSNPVKEAYVGTTKIKEIYVGNTKIL